MNDDQLSKKLIHEKYCIVCVYWIEADDSPICNDCKCKSNFVQVADPHEMCERAEEYRETCGE
ncbi:MAG: hypothetical protein ABFD07_14110 [Methanobacterium sp.]